MWRKVWTQENKIRWLERRIIEAKDKVKRSWRLDLLQKTWPSLVRGQKPLVGKEKRESCHGWPLLDLSHHEPGDETHPPPASAWPRGDEWRTSMRGLE